MKGIKTCNDCGRVMLFDVELYLRNRERDGEDWAGWYCPVCDY